MSKTVLAISAMILTAASLMGGGGSDMDEGGSEPIIWKFGHLSNEEHLWHKTAMMFAEEVNTSSNGMLEIRIFPNEQLGSEIDTINDIKTGTADMTITGESLSNWAPEAALLGMPYAIIDEDHMRAVVDGPLGAEIEDTILEEVGLRPLYYHRRAPRNLTSNRAISSPGDLRGFKMRVPNVPSFLDAWQAAGANPQVMAFSEVFTGLQQGVIEGQENPYDLIVSASFFEVQEFVNETEHVFGWIYVVVGEKQFNALSPGLQDVVLSAAANAEAWADSQLATATAEAKARVQAEGMTINGDVDKQAFQELMLPAVKENLNPAQIDLLNRIVEAGR